MHFGRICTGGWFSWKTGMGLGYAAVYCKRPPSATVTSDASGGWGCGVFTHSGEWFQFQWHKAWEHVHITVKELLPIVVACAVWTGLTACLFGHTITHRVTSTSSSVLIPSSARSKDPVYMRPSRWRDMSTINSSLS